jgi:hypothetical protein
MLRVFIDNFFQGFPQEFTSYLIYCRSLQFDEAPDYIYLRQLFRVLFRQLNFHYDYVFDWTILKQAAQSPVPEMSALTIDKPPGGSCVWFIASTTAVNS